MQKKILIVDDSAAIRQMVSLTLKEAGYSVLVAANGKDALGISGVIDLVIADLNMPEMDGIELIKQFRSMPEFKFVPIVMLTTESQEALKQEGKRSGASGWIVKPFTQEQLMEVVKKFVK
jgi:two-component system chemotaxis response regulator CheY